MNNPGMNAQMQMGGAYGAQNFQNRVQNNPRPNRARSRSSSLPRRLEGKSDHLIRIALPIERCGGIIGRSGTKINDIRRESNAIIELKTVRATSVKKRMLHIRGVSPTSCIHAAQLIAKRISELNYEAKNRPKKGGKQNKYGDYIDENNSQGNKNKNVRVDLMFLITTNQVGAILGRSGNKIKDIRKKCGITVKVDTERLYKTNEKTLFVSGFVDRVCEAIDLLFTIALDHVGNEARILWYPSFNEEAEALQNAGIGPNEPNSLGFSGPNSIDINRPPSYDPYSYENGRSMFSNYNDYPQQRPMRSNYASPYGPPPLNSDYYDPYQSDRYYPQSNRGYSSSKYSSQDDFVNFTPIHGPKFSRRDLEYGHGMEQMTSGGYASTTDHFRKDEIVVPYPISTRQAGALIGRSGCKINDIRRQSGAFVRVEEAKPGSSDRMVTVKGNSSQIKSAISMIKFYLDRD